MLRIGGYAWPIVSSGNNFLQHLSHRGAPNSKVQAQGLFVVLDGSGADTHFFTDALLNQPRAATHAGEAVFHDADGKTLRQVEFEDGLIASHQTYFEPGRADGLPALIEVVHIKAPIWYVDGQRHPFQPEAPARERPPAKQDKPSPPDLKCWAVFRRKVMYKGEFGFDWLEWKKSTTTIERVQDIDINNLEYVFDDATQNYVSTAKNPALRKQVLKEYQQISVYGNPYFAPWLSMQPGQSISLVMTPEYLNTADLRNDYLTFAHNDAYEVTVNGQVNDEIRLTPYNGFLVSVDIKCIKPGPATALLVKDELGTVVGKINVVGNQHKYKLPIRIVYLMRNSTTISKRLKRLQSIVESRQTTFQNSLNTNAFAQAFIECEFEKPDSPHVFLFDAARWAKDGYYAPLTNELKHKNEYEYILDYIPNQVKNLPPFKGITLFTTNLSLRDKSIGEMSGYGNLHPTTSSNIILFASGLNDKTIYAHEIGHVLGLEHSFLNQGTCIALEAAKIERKSLRKLIQLQNNDLKITKSKIASIFKTEGYTKAYQLDIERIEKENRNFASRIKEIDELFSFYSRNKFLYTQSLTGNIMDYYNNGSVFCHWQWEIMQNEIVNIHGSKKYAK
jgi:hypothetical protein